MDKRETDELGQVLQLLDDGNAAGASSLLRRLLQPNSPQPEGEAYPMWVHHPDGGHPSRIANSSDEEKKIQAEWKNEGISRNATPSASPVPENKNGDQTRTSARRTA